MSESERGMEEGREKGREAGKTERETSFTLFTTIIMHTQTMGKRNNQDSYTQSMTMCTETMHNNVL